MYSNASINQYSYEGKQIFFCKCLRTPTNKLISNIFEVRKLAESFCDRKVQKMEENVIKRISKKKCTVRIGLQIMNQINVMMKM